MDRSIYIIAIVTVILKSSSEDNTSASSTEILSLYVTTSSVEISLPVSTAISTEGSTPTETNSTYIVLANTTIVSSTTALTTPETTTAAATTTPTTATTIINTTIVTTLTETSTTISPATTTSAAVAIITPALTPTAAPTTSAALTSTTTIATSTSNTSEATIQITTPTSAALATEALPAALTSATTSTQTWSTGTTTVNVSKQWMIFEDLENQISGLKDERKSFQIAVIILSVFAAALTICIILYFCIKRFKAQKDFFSEIDMENPAFQRRKPNHSAVKNIEVPSMFALERVSKAYDPSDVNPNTADKLTTSFKHDSLQ